MSKKKILSLLLIALLAVSILFGFSKSKRADVIYYNKAEVVKQTVLQENEILYFNVKSGKEMEKIGSSEMTRLYFDKENGSIALYDTATKKFWRSIPEVYGNVKTGAVTLEVICDEGIFTLCSQDDSTVQYETGENSVKVTYKFEASLTDKITADITVPVVYALRNGILYAETDCSEIINNSRKITVRSISLLPFFGADREKAEGDYLLIPDGSGATIDLSENPESFEAIELPVYSADLSLEKSSEKKVLMGTFGIKRGNSAFAAVIEEGAEFARIKAEKALEKSGLNSVCAFFDITPTAETDDGRLAVSEKAYEGKIRISYRFLSNQNADYIGMASAVRETLIRNGNLPMATRKAEGEYPFNLSVIGVGYEKNSGQNRILASYAQTFDILSTLKAKGIGTINLRYRGLFEGGVNQRDITSADFALNDRKELEELVDYAKNHDITIFADVSLITASVKGNFASKALTLGESYTVKKSEAFEQFESGFISPKKLADVSEKMLVLLRDSDFDGVTANSEGRILYSDFSSGRTSLRDETAKQISNELASVSASKHLMVDTGNLYAVKHASGVVNLPSVSSCKGKELCTAVPFVQAVYHGFFDYSLTPVNTANVSETMFLRAVEYGAVPYFEWYYADCSTEEEKDKYHYLASVNDAQLYYQRMSAVFSDLRNARITAHEKVKKGVFMTEYEGSTRIYVNYNKTAVTVAGVTIEPRSFVRVN